jgi:hypothetical protein
MYPRTGNVNDILHQLELQTLHPKTPGPEALNSNISRRYSSNSNSGTIRNIHSIIDSLRQVRSLVCECRTLIQTRHMRVSTSLSI